MPTSSFSTARPGPTLLPGDLVLERRPVRAPGPGEVVVRNIVTSVDPYQLRMLRGSPEVTPVAIGESVPANSVGIVVASEDPGVPVGTQVATYTGWQAYATTTIADRKSTRLNSSHGSISYAV